MIVFGESMLPTIQPGSFVVMRTETQYTVGDVVGFKYSEKDSSKNIVHRIIEKTDSGFVTKGDNNKHRDPGVASLESVAGKVFLVIPYVGYAIVFIRNPLMIGLVAIVIMLISAKKKSEKRQNPARQAKSDYQLLLGALVANGLTYALYQISINFDIRPKSDVFTNLFFRLFEPSFASTMVFTLYFFLLVGVFFLTKKTKTIQTTFKHKNNLMLVEKPNHILMGAQLLWLLFIMISMIQLSSLFQNLIVHLPR